MPSGKSYVTAAADDNPVKRGRLRGHVPPPSGPTRGCGVRNSFFAARLPAVQPAATDLGRGLDQGADRDQSDSAGSCEVGSSCAAMSWTVVRIAWDRPSYDRDTW